MLAPDGELTSDRLVVLLLVDCKPSRSNQRNMTLKSGLTENAPYKCNICFATHKSRHVKISGIARRPHAGLVLKDRICAADRSVARDSGRVMMERILSASAISATLILLFINVMPFANAAPRYCPNGGTCPAGTCARDGSSSACFVRACKKENGHGYRASQQQSRQPQKRQ
jgi:hypothetical protein